MFPARDTATPPLPTRFAEILLAFAPLYAHLSWRHAQLLQISAILTPGRRTVTSVLRILGDEAGREACEGLKRYRFAAHGEWAGVTIRSSSRSCVRHALIATRAGTELDSCQAVRGCQAIRDAV